MRISNGTVRIVVVVYKDRGRSVANPKWEDLTDDKEAIETLREVYGNNGEELDVLVEKRIKGFANSGTAFNMFLLMALRMLDEDGFFTSNYNEDVYTKKGLELIQVKV